MSVTIKKNKISQKLVELMEKNNLNQSQKDLWKRFSMSLDDEQLSLLDKVLVSDESAFAALTQKIAESNS